MTALGVGRQLVLGWALWLCALTLGIGGAACSSKPTKDPTPEEWEQALEVVDRRENPASPGMRTLRAPPGWVAPHLGYPSDGAVIDSAQVARDQGLFVFGWSMAAVEARYQLEFARDRNFLETERREIAARGIFLLRDIPAGQHYWRVRVMNASGKFVGLESNVQRFEFKPVE